MTFKEEGGVSAEINKKKLAISIIQRQYRCNIFPAFVILTTSNQKMWIIDIERKCLLFDIKYRISTGHPQVINSCILRVCL